MNDGENNVTTSQDGTYAEVSLRAVELLAKAQRAADEAVAEAQSYARDLEKSARDQYKQILQRAQSAAQQVATAEGARDGQGAPGGAGSVDAQQLAYVRTYARVAHTQLKSVLAALNEELDQLAAMAEGSNDSAALSGLPPGRGPHDTKATYAPALSDPAPGETQPSWQPADQSASDASPSEINGTAAWPPITAATNSVSYFHRGSSWEAGQS